MLGVPTNQQQCLVGKGSSLDIGSFSELQQEPIKQPASLSYFATRNSGWLFKFQQQGLGNKTPWSGPPVVVAKSYEFQFCYTSFSRTNPSEQVKLCRFTQATDQKTCSGFLQNCNYRCQNPKHHHHLILLDSIVIFLLIQELAGKECTKTTFSHF